MGCTLLLTPLGVDRGRLRIRVRVIDRSPALARFTTYGFLTAARCRRLTTVPRSRRTVVIVVFIRALEAYISYNLPATGQLHTIEHRVRRRRGMKNEATNVMLIYTSNRRKTKRWDATDLLLGQPDVRMPVTIPLIVWSD